MPTPNVASFDELARVPTPVLADVYGDNSRSQASAVSWGAFAASAAAAASLSLILLMLGIGLGAVCGVALEARWLKCHEFRHIDNRLDHIHATHRLRHGRVSGGQAQN